MIKKKTVLGAVSSRYIGETEKNLKAAAGRMDRTGLFLFFDEADGLFGLQKTKTFPEEKKKKK